MNKSRLFQWTTVILVVLNIGLMVFILINKPGGQNHHGPDTNKNLIIEKLGFDEKQVAEYEVLIDQHRSAISETDQEIRLAKNALYSLLNEENQEGKDSIVQVIAENQRAIEEIHFNHFAAIKQLCTAEQLPKFYELTKDLGRMFAPEPHKRPRKH